jgi:hypothetical protein
MKKSSFLSNLLLVGLAGWLVAAGVSCGGAGETDSGLTFGVAFSAELSEEPLDGRMLLLISNDDSREPRFQISDGPNAQLVYGLDVNALRPGEEAVFDAGVFGFPLRSFAEIPAGEYSVQGLLHIYETFQRADGHVVKLPMDRGEGQRWSRAPGNIYSTPKRVYIDPAEKGRISITLDQKIPPIPDPPETRYIKHVKIQSKLLTKFWGRPMYLGAHVLLPEGFEEHPDDRYPLMVFHGHFPYDFGGFSEEPPDPDLEPDYSARFDLKGYNRIQQEQAYEFYKTWTGPNFPRFIVIEIQHANPYYDDSYAVNSANLGPYGDAITYELIPFIEEKFRGVGEGWARFLYGGSTGGWEALGVQVLYPDDYNGCFAACPDPIDFRAYTTVNIYEDKNAYAYEGVWKQVPRPGHRDWLGHISALLRDQNYMELALATHSRSGGQWDIWQAVFSPVGEDGYPKPIWDKLTGEIDPEVAAYWRENYDLRYILERDWKTLGPKLEGKIHIYCGDMDNYYLNNAVYLMEDFLEKTTDPFYGGEVDYGDRAEHCWNGDHTRPNALSRLRYNVMYLPLIKERLRRKASRDTPLRNWRLWED